MLFLKTFTNVIILHCLCLGNLYFSLILDISYEKFKLKKEDILMHGSNGDIFGGILF